ncbi:hypothetical protein [Mycobacterium kyogaense]|nr:hypothetical protein [Mycobacterium kyogaense]
MASNLSRSTRNVTVGMGSAAVTRSSPRQICAPVQRMFASFSSSSIA